MCRIQLTSVSRLGRGCSSRSETQKTGGRLRLITGGVWSLRRMSKCFDPENLLFSFCVSSCPSQRQVSYLSCSLGSNLAHFRAVYPPPCVSLDVSFSVVDIACICVYLRVSVCRLCYLLPSSCKTLRNGGLCSSELVSASTTEGRTLLRLCVCQSDYPITYL